MRLRHYLSLNVMSSEKKRTRTGGTSSFCHQSKCLAESWTSHCSTVHCSLLREYKAESRRKVFPRPAVKKVQGEFDTEGEFPKAGCLEDVGQGQQIKTFNNSNAKLL